MRYLPVFALLLAASALPASAQIWANHPADHAAASPGYAPDRDASNAAPAATAQPTDAEMPRTVPPSPGSSLGGSGDTGTDSIGILPARDTGFGRATWRYTDFQTVLSQMEQLPERIASAAQHELAKNLLVSIADAPSGDDGGSALLELRVAKLLALGNVVDAAALARAAPALPDNARLAHLEVEAELLAGQVESACIDLRAFSAVLTDPASQNALALCQQTVGDVAENAPLPLDAQSLGAAARIAGLPLAADPRSSTPAQLVAAALDTRNDPALRIEAGFAAGRVSAVYGEFLSKLFAAASGGASPAAEGSAPTDGASAAALYQAIAQDGAMDQRLALAERGLLSPLGIADKIGVAMVAPLRGFEPVPELAGVAHRFAALFYTIGDLDAAAPWVELADSAGNPAPLWPYRVLIKQADIAGMADWERSSGLDAPHIARIRLILAVFGFGKPPSAATRIAWDDQPETPLPQLLAMDQSAKDLHVGETALRALAVLGGNGPARAHPLALRRVLADLEQVSLHNEARALAFEAITATLFDGRQSGAGQIGSLRFGSGP